MGPFGATFYIFWKLNASLTSFYVLRINSVLASVSFFSTYWHSVAFTYRSTHIIQQYVITISQNLSLLRSVCINTIDLQFGNVKHANMIRSVSRAAS